MMTDPIADMLTRIRNAMRAGHAEAVIPFSTIKLAIANKMKDSGYLENVESVGDGARKQLVIKIKYDANKNPVVRGIKKVSKPGRRVYLSAYDIKPLKGGIGMSILSTPKGVLADFEARKSGVGGEVICELW